MSRCFFPGIEVIIVFGIAFGRDGCAIVNGVGIVDDAVNEIAQGVLVDGERGIVLQVIVWHGLSHVTPSAEGIAFAFGYLGYYDVCS